MIQHRATRDPDNGKPGFSGLDPRAALRENVGEGVRAVTTRTRAILKQMIHHALDVIDRVKEMSADAFEHYQDLVAEVEAERDAEKRRKAGPGDSKTVPIHSDDPESE